jgi:hypothetical protein
MNRRLLVVSCVAILFLGTTIAMAESINVSFNVAPQSTDATLIIGAPDDPRPATASMTFSGALPTALDVTYVDGAPVVNGITFTPTQYDSPWQPGTMVYCPGSLNVSDTTFTFTNLEDYGYGYPPGLVNQMTELTMNVATVGARTVTDGQFSVGGANLDIVTGLVYSNLFTYPADGDLEDNFYPRQDQGGPDGGGGARHIILSDTDTLSSITVVHNADDNSYGYILNLNSSFYKEGIDPGFDLAGATAMVATYNVHEVPEPATLAMVLGLVASLAVYGWKRSR